MAIIPAVMFLEMTLDSMKDQDAIVLEKELREFRSLGNRIERKNIYPENMSDQEEITDMEKGYLIGIETARILISSMPAAVNAGVKL